MPCNTAIQRSQIQQRLCELFSGKVSKDTVVEAVLKDGAVKFENVETPTV